MKRSLALFAVFCFALIQSSATAVPGDSDEAKKELKLFQGKWDAIGGQSFDGVVPTDIELQLTSLEVDGDQFTLKTGSLTVKGAFSIDPTKKPKTIDVYFGDNKDNPMRGIYVIDGDTRKSCFAKPGKDRPDKFRKENEFLINEWRAVK
jgi:uncharacterized protein (TIGR03067 family)